MRCCGALLADFGPIFGVKSSNVPICPVMPFATAGGSREYAVGLFAWARIAA